jgi:hypothetical protein
MVERKYDLEDRLIDFAVLFSNVADILPDGYWLLDIGC